MPSSFKWRFEMDLSRDNLWEYDFTAYVQEAEWSLGATEAFATMANDAKATLKVINTNGEFNPEDVTASNPFVVDGANLLRPHRRVRIVQERYDSRVPAGLIQSLPLDELTGTNANDSSSENNDGTYSAGVVLNSADSPIPRRRMPRFNGDDTVNLYSAAMAADFDPNAGSVSLWIQPYDVSVWSTTSYQYIFRLLVDGNNWVQIYKNNTPVNWLVFEYKAGGTLSQVIVPMTVIADARHIGMTWDTTADEFKVYVDGVQQGTTQTGLGTWAGTISAFASILGAEVSAGATLGWNGYLSHYRLYDVAITAANMATLATNGDEVLYVGWIRRISPVYVPAAEHTGKTLASLTCEGIKSRLDTVTVPLGIYEDATGDEIVADALLLAAIPPAAPGGWLAGMPGYSEAGITTFAGSDAGYSDLDVGVTTFPLLGDKENTGWQGIKLVTDGERAFFYQRRDGKAVWRNRHSRLLITTSEATISDTANKAVKIDYEWALEDIKNSIRVTVNPRKLASSTTVHDQQTQVTVPPGATKTYEVPFRDVDGKSIGVSGLAGTPVFSGATPTTTLTNIGNRAQVEINNSANSTAATLTSLPLTGQPIQDRDPVIGKAMDADSVGEFGKRELALNIPALNTLQQAEDIAQFELLRRKDARPSIGQVNFKHVGDDSDNTLQLDLAIESRVTLTLPSKNHSSDHFIIGERHSWKRGGNKPVHDTAFYLEPANASQFWIAEVVGYSEAGQTTYGAY